MMANQNEVQTAVVGALASQPRSIPYPDYKTSADFPLWLSGFRAKIRHAYGFKLTETDKVNEEVVRGISGKLTVGTALDAYLELSEVEKADYKQLVARLTAEFCDPIEKRKFEDNLAYNKRKSGQSLKDYKQTIVKDMNRYSSIPAKIPDGAGGSVSNPEKEKQEVKRFRAGLRDQEGKKDRIYSHHMRYHLMEDKDLTWKVAMGLASRWEGAESDPEESGKAEEDSSSSESDDDVKAVDVKPKKKQKESKKSKTKCSHGEGVIATLSDKVQENQVKIKQIETTQERMSKDVKDVKEIMATYNGSLQTIEAKLDAGFAQGGRGYQSNTNSYQQQVQPQQQQFRPQQQQYRPQQPFNQQQYNQRGGGGVSFRPRNFTWSARTQQQRQGNYGLQRRTPTNFTPGAQNQTAKTTVSAPTATTATPNPAIASLGEGEMNAEPLFACEQEEDQQVSMPYADFIHLTGQAGIDPNDVELSAMIDQMNFT